jgi:hypothetical protein
MVIRILLLFFFPLAAQSQLGKSGFLVLKKGNKTVGRYYTGNTMQFYTTESMPVSGVVDRITADSIYLYQYQIRRMQRADGAVIFDTTGRFPLSFSIANIGSFPAGRQKGKNLLTNGTLLMIGGAGYLVVNMVNTVREGDPPFGEDNLSNVLIATGAVATGFLLKKSWPSRWYIGKKYKLQVMAG